MEAALALPREQSAPKGRATKKGAFWRALPRLVFLTAVLCGGVLVTKALYIPVKAEVAQVLLARAFDQSLAGGAPVKPWSWADTAPLARISAPRLGQSEIVLSGGSGEAMAFGPTALVDDQASGITVLAAHRDTHFEFVQDLLIGDDIWMERIDGSTANYRTARVDIVRWDEFAHPSYASDTGSEGLIALTTCYPFDTHEPGPLRYVVWAELVAE